MNELYFYPRKISLNKTMCFSKAKSYAFGALVGSIKRSDLNVLSLNTSSDFHFHHKNNSNTNFIFDDIEFHSSCVDKNDCFGVIKAAILQSICHQCFGLKKSLDFYNNPNQLVDLGFVNDIDIYVITNLKRLILSNTKSELNDAHHDLPYSDYKSCWIAYCIDVSSIVEGTEETKKTLDFVLGWNIEPDKRIVKLDDKIQEKLDELSKIREITSKKTLDLMNIKSQIDNSENSIMKIESKKNEILSRGVVMREAPKEHLSLYTFKYTIDTNQTSKITSKQSVIDMMIYSETLCFKKRKFDIDWNSGNPRSLGSNTIEFSANSKNPIRVVPMSRRTKKQRWIYEGGNHTFNTLLKGLFGEMLLSTGIVPVERTIDESGLHGNEAFAGYITTKSLQRSITQPASVYFNDSHNNIINDLNMFYKTLWKEDEIEFVNIFHNNKGLIEGDILKIPVEITFKYTLRGCITKQDKECRAVEGTWCMLYHFNVMS